MSALNNFSEIEIVAIDNQNRAGGNGRLNGILGHFNKKHKTELQRYGRDVVKKTLIPPSSSDGKNPIKMIKANVGMGCRISSTIDNAIWLSRELAFAPVQFDFNGETITVKGKDRPQEIVQQRNEAQAKARKLYQAEREAYDKSLEGIWDREREEAKRLARKELLAKAQIVIDRTTLEITDNKAWATRVQSDKESMYKGGITRFAERWGKLMQASLRTLDRKDGHTFESIAKATERLADDRVNSGHVYNCAVAQLASS
ncbi:MAG: hypothetical protein WC612_04815 [Bdellovibrionales bacterium]|jgi:hypothetical protein